ncbi:MAG: sugar nucleotide-binding protein, partial [Thermodesulfobacteriota bacterium]
MIVRRGVGVGVSSGKILITGANGQLGQDLGAVLRAGGDSPLCLSREDLDIADDKAVSGLILHEAPGIVLNTAAYTKVDLAEKEKEKAFAVNRDGARNVARACDRAGALECGLRAAEPAA